ncbi:cellulase family glycosylhydrolase [Gordonia polyisoprenivorans]|uniref:cellulase family glycosylhydrolase n=1 Tax=Gordonia polyisoprenivorans TaxID=84595 RepID=UPI00037A204B|nr:cellulase family glycosylhydrolase [Gordonia polyisoprenivorans]QUD81758.1 cellulase family glycosylhydrolase [Gordonia polyisoprenivorans]
MHALATPLARRIGAGVLAVGIAGTMVGATMWSLPSAEPATTTNLQVALSSVAEEPTQLGVTDDQIYRMSDAQLNATLDDLQALGVTDLRVGAPLSFLHQDGDGWARLDAIVDGARARGMTVVIVASLNSPWTPSSGPAASSPAEFADFAKLLASRYRGKVAGYEVWNEVGTTISAFVPADVLQDLLDAASAAIQAADPGALVRTQQVLSLLLPTPSAPVPDVVQTVVPMPSSAPVVPSAAPAAPAPETTPDTDATQTPGGGDGAGGGDAGGGDAGGGATSTTATATPSETSQTPTATSPATNSPATQTVTPDSDPPDGQPGDDPGDTAAPHGTVVDGPTPEVAAAH